MPILFSDLQNSSPYLMFFVSFPIDESAHSVPSLPLLTSCTPTSQILWPLPEVNLTCTGSLHSTFQIAKPFSFVCVVRRISPDTRWFCTIRNMFMFVSSSPFPQAGGPPLAGCLRLFIYHIRNNLTCWR